MRLINIHTLELEEFPTHTQTPYAILSHRWGNEEVSYETMLTPERTEFSGFFKIQSFCNLIFLQRERIDYVWVDTCCIDKRSSAELSEAINSMYRWYADAVCCYAFLEDVHGLEGFADSVWFMRSWTLQELIAPSNVKFYNKDWRLLGTREDLQEVIRVKTGIDPAVYDMDDLNECSVAQRMSWAAHRGATRVEDQAYSLMGLFDVNMPMLYGEGEKAFIRLQEEIIRRSDDHSIFTWSRPHIDYSGGLLATKPLFFADCQYIVRRDSLIESEAYSLTNVGLSIKLVMFPWAMNVFCATLDCTQFSLPDARMAIFLRYIPDARKYSRMSFDSVDTAIIGDEQLEKRIAWCPPGYDGTKVLVRQKAPPYVPLDIYGFHVSVVRVETYQQSVTVDSMLEIPGCTWEAENRILSIPPGVVGLVCEMYFPVYHFNNVSSISLGFDTELSPLIEVTWNLAARDRSSTRLKQLLVPRESVTPQEARSKIRQIFEKEDMFKKKVIGPANIKVTEPLEIGSCLIKVSKDKGLNIRVPELGVKLAMMWEIEPKTSKRIWKFDCESLEYSRLRWMTALPSNPP